MSSYFNIDKTPPPIRRPDRDAMQALDEALQQRSTRSRRSLQTCHRPAPREQHRPYSGKSNAFVPQVSARLINDPALSDGARRCAAKLMELIYRRNRRGRGLGCTVSYLAKALGRSERTIQTYLAQLRGRGYIRHEVVTSQRARMCIGVFVTLLRPLFPQHHEREWPVHAAKSGVKKDSEKYISNKTKETFKAIVDVDHWALRCMDGVWRSFMKMQPALVMKTLSA